MLIRFPPVAAVADGSTWDVVIGALASEMSGSVTPSNMKYGYSEQILKTDNAYLIIADSNLRSTICE
jgi:hypothetical protein